MESIFSQTHQDWELIVCDSYSDDGTWEYLQQFKHDPRVHLFQVPKEGLYAGWNECLKRATGEYIYFATADDTMLPNCLSTFIKSFDLVQDVEIVLTEVLRIDANGNLIDYERPQIWKFLNPQHPLQAERLSGHTFFILLCGFASGFGSITGLMLRRSLFEKTGPFPTDLWFLGDCEWALKAVLHSDVLVLPMKLATWRSHDHQASSSWNLRAACLFLRSLERVLETELMLLPTHWKVVSNWRVRLLEARTIEAELATKLTVRNILSYPSLLLNWIIEATKHAPLMLFRRICCGFRLTERQNSFALLITQNLLRDFDENWPHQRTFIQMASIDPAE